MKIAVNRKKAVKEDKKRGQAKVVIALKKKVNKNNLRVDWNRTETSIAEKKISLIFGF